MMNMRDELPGDARSRFGTAEELRDGRIRVRFERRLPHPVERVWAALVDREELTKWFPEITLEPRTGGRFEIVFGSGEGSDCQGPSIVSGEITHFEPPSLLQCGTMRWELEPDGDGCILRFVDIVAVDGGRSERETARSVLSGWHWYLDALEEALAGRFVDRSRPEVSYTGQLL
jgi:uncharacterized protein YndB with AHSA1/START domain